MHIHIAYVYISLLVLCIVDLLVLNLSWQSRSLQTYCVRLVFYWFFTLFTMKTRILFTH